MNYLTRVQRIKRAGGTGQWYVGLPSALASSLELEKGEAVTWTIIDKTYLVLTRLNVPPDPVELDLRAADQMKKVERLIAEAKEKGLLRQLGSEQSKKPNRQRDAKNKE